MKRHIKLIKTFLKPSKRDERKNVTHKNCGSLKVTREIHGVLCKEILGKCTTKSLTLSTKITVNKTGIFDAEKIADEFNKFFTNIGTDLANKIPNASKLFDSYITKANTSMESQPLSINELKDTFFSLKFRLSPSKKGCGICFIESPLKTMKNPFYFILKAHFVLKIFNFLS